MQILIHIGDKEDYYLGQQTVQCALVALPLVHLCKFRLCTVAKVYVCLCVFEFLRLIHMICTPPAMTTTMYTVYTMVSLHCVPCGMVAIR